MSAFQRFAQDAPVAMRLWLVKRWAIAWRAAIKYNETDGEQRAASFAYYAFFAMFPLMVLLLTIATDFFGNKTEAAAKIIAYISDNFLPIEAQDSKVLFNTVQGVVQSRRSAGVIAFCIVAWSALKFFQALVHGVNRAWGTKQYPWWRMPIKNLFMTTILASALLLGIVVPTVLTQIEDFYFINSRKVGLDFGFLWYLFHVAKLAVPVLVLFYGFAMFYKFAPRRRTLLREVWTSALFVTLALALLQRLFIFYSRNVDYRSLYGTFGSVVVILLWIYLSGSIIILGGCICAARYEIDMSLSDQAESNRAED